jgi:hypothetical protein
MALKSSGKNASTAKPAVDTAQFEEMETETTTTNEVQSDDTGNDTVIEGEAEVVEQTNADDDEQNAPTEDQAAAATQAASQQGKAEPTEQTAVAEKAGGALSQVKVGNLTYDGPAYRELQNNFDASSLDWNTFPRVKVNLEGFQDEDGDLVGKQLVLEIMSFNNRFVVTTNVEGQEELAKFSLDGKVIDETGQPVAEYIAFLKGEGFADASSKKYLDLYGMLVAVGDNDKGTAIRELPPEEQEIICVQVPPMSIGKFTRLQINEAVRMKRTGRTEEKFTLLLTQDKVKGSKRTFAQINFDTYNPA